MEEKFCAAHLDRTGKLVPATHIVDEEPMCEACFKGQPLFVPKPRRKRAQEHAGARSHAAPELHSPMRSSLSPCVRFTVNPFW